MGESIVKICIVGLGYIGLPTASLLACSGYRVHGVDINEHAVNSINKGLIHIDEPELDQFVRKAVGEGMLKASLEPDFADVFILCVPTPFHHSDNPNSHPRPNLSYVLAATKAVAPYVRPGNIVILESTSPVGTTEEVKKTLEECGVDTSLLSIAYCPERVLPGQIMTELVMNDRIVGGITPEATQRVKTFYETFVKGNVFGTESKTAEMAKLVENSYRDVNIAFANELSMLCEEVGIDVWQLINLANRHPRVQILQPGAGVGGHCIAVDPWFIVHQNPAVAQLIKTARLVNNSKQEWVAEQVVAEAAKFKFYNKREPIIACLGLAFKPDIADLRESPSIAIVESLIGAQMDVRAVEPNIEGHPTMKIYGLSDAVESADIVVILVKHKQFAGHDFGNKMVLDYCGLHASLPSTN